MPTQEIALAENLQEVSAAGLKGQIPQYSAAQIMAIWATAVLPMGLLAWSSSWSEGTTQPAVETGV